MKICRVGEHGRETPAFVDEAGVLRDISAVVPDIDSAFIAADGLSRLAAVDLEKLPAITGTPRYGVPIADISKMVCIGLNYSDHAHESGLPIPSEPIIFLKAPSAFCGANDPTPVPVGSSKLDWEVELGVVIGKVARNVSVEDALDYVAGYCVVNDISERAFQMQSSQWDKGKSCDNFGPIGPWFVTRDEVADPQNLGMKVTVNGSVMQDGNTSTMIFDVRTLISYTSRYMTLMPGDIIATGTPPGVGMGKKPEPIWLKVGDVVEVQIEGLGVQRQSVIEQPR